MYEFVDIMSNVVGLLYKRELAVFAMSTMIISFLICILDMVSIKLFDKSSLLGVGYGGWRSVQSLLLWGVGAGLGAYVGGLAELFDVQSLNSILIVGAGWPTVLPRILAMSSRKEEEVEETEQDEEEE